MQSIRKEIKYKIRTWLFLNHVKLVLILGVIAILGIGAGVYALKHPHAAVAVDNQTLLADVGQLVTLPTDETPTIATVTDPEKLKGQAFFANAKAGDKVIFFSKAKRAILYDPSAKKIIEVAPLNLDQTP